jgi:hypothetical protein
MKIKNRDNSAGSKVLTGMIVNTRFLRRIAALWKAPGLFADKWTNLVGGWCVDYLKRYNKAPRHHIEDLYQEWSEKYPENEAADPIEKLLRRLSSKHAATSKSLNVDLLLDQANELFLNVRIEKMKRSLEQKLQTGQSQAALQEIMTFKPTLFTSDASINFFGSPERWKDTLEHAAEPLVIYPNDLGVFFGDELGRDQLVAFQGPEKRGKTWWLLDVAWTAITQARRVAFFEVGDMSERQILSRFLSRLSGRPRVDREVKIPRRIYMDESEGTEICVDHDVRQMEKMDYASVTQQARKYVQKLGSNDLLRIAVHPAASVSVEDIHNRLHAWADAGWVADVVVVDYADILASPSSGRGLESRVQIDHTWMGLRSLSQTFHACVVTATQANASAYSLDTLDMSTFSGSKTKNAHVTGMIGINQTPAEKKLGVIRLNWLARRENEFSPDACCFVAQCLPLARPGMLSLF